MATVQLTFDKTATQSEQESVKQAFEDAGLSAEVFVELIESRSVDIPPWVIYATAAAGGIFFTGFIGQAGADAWKGLRDLIGKVFDARCGRAARFPLSAKRKQTPISNPARVRAGLAPGRPINRSPCPAARSSSNRFPN